MPSIQTQPISSQSSQSDYRPQSPVTSQIIYDTNMGRFIQWLTGEIPGFVSTPKSDLPPKTGNKESWNYQSRPCRRYAQAIRRSSYQSD